MVEAIRAFCTRSELLRRAFDWFEALELENWLWMFMTTSNPEPFNRRQVHTRRLTELLQLMTFTIYKDLHD